MSRHEYCRHEQARVLPRRAGTSIAENEQARVLPKTSTREYCRDRTRASIAETEHARVLPRTSTREYCRERALTNIAEVLTQKNLTPVLPRRSRTRTSSAETELARVLPKPSTSTAENEHARVLSKPDMEKSGAMQSVTAQEAKDFLHNTSSSSAWPFLATITQDIWDPPTLAVPFPQQGRQTGPNHASSSPDKSGQF